MLNFIKNCESYRSKLRKNIIEQRVKDLNNHSDIEPIDGSSDRLERSITSMEASHIFAISSIKSLAKKAIEDKSFEEELYKDCTNPNNGIFLPKDYHFYFDRGGISINSSGEFIFRSEYIEEFNKIGIVPCRIKKEYLNNEMKKYIHKRT